MPSSVRPFPTGRTTENEKLNSLEWQMDILKVVQDVFVKETNTKQL